MLELARLFSAQGLEHTLAHWIALYGPWALALIALIIFAETGLVVAPLLPGDSLLFITGAVIAAAGYSVHATVLVLLIAAVIGNAVNFTVGRTAADWLLPRLKGRWLRPAHLDMTQAYFARWGNATIVVSRFVPIVRTIAPFLAGCGHMHAVRFMFFNVVGAAMWVAGFVYAGALLGGNGFVRSHLGWITIGILIASVVPLAVVAVRGRQSSRRAAHR